MKQLNRAPYRRVKLHLAPFRFKSRTPAQNLSDDAHLPHFPAIETQRVVEIANQQMLSQVAVLVPVLHI